MDWNRKKDTRGQSGSNFRAEPAIKYRAHATMLIWHSCGNTGRNAGNVRPISEEENSNTCSRDSRLIDLEIEGRNHALYKTGQGAKKQQNRFRDELVTAPDRPCRGHRKNRSMRVLFKAAAQ